ncbi:Methyl-CpG-binding domain-containing protein 8 [Sesamum alatum]|uniref:Methyl-CpG-binding domain-containing protein 8 n=1 Tax=Sesamum alatum TaxID=300844 RepID=A0AAE2CNE0_9LAMI|nr:Methyl-CpG-binding domain-containing protein 8 [Sesamum alatum]
MASAAVDSPATIADGGSLKLDSIPIVDIRLLSQSELYSLSLCSSSAFDPRRCDDVVIPKIDRSVFNESAGSRKQTYSRLRLAPPSSSSTATSRRRAPHLRPSATTFASMNSNNSDPENAENSQIVSLLKQLFVTDLNPDELVPVKIDYSHSLPPQPLSSLPPTSLSNVGATGYKRKRGRPRRNELLGNEVESVLGVSVVDVNDGADGFSSLNEIVVHENVEDRDREVLNRDGVAVDLVALGRVEHPYRDEIRRRTEGLQTEEELLGFLRGLNGQWGSRRKKKRIVDANELGMVLPIGWKLLLCVKKKNGHVWLDCRRYISPGGLYFVSCKGVSSYLLSLHGVQDTNSYSSALHNEIIDDANKLTNFTVADLAVQVDDRKENLVSHTSLPTFGSTSGNHEMQVTIKARDLPEDNAQNTFHCSKCNITFNEKDELLQHQSSLHRRNRYKNGMRLTDGVIIKDGKYECQFCHKTFSERHRYNGHIGAHVRYQANIAGESSGGRAGESVDPSSFGFPVRDCMMGGSLGSDNVMDICNATANNGLNICSPRDKDNEHDGDLKEGKENMKVAEATDIVVETNPCSVAEGNENMIVAEVTDVVAETSPCSVAEVLLSGNRNKSFNDDAHADGCVVEKIDAGASLQGKRSGNCSPLPLDDATCGVTNGGELQDSASMEKPEQSMICGSSLLDSNNHVEECDVVNNEHISPTNNELKPDSENFSVNGSIFNFFGTYGDQDKHLAASLMQQSNFDHLPCKNIGNTDNTSTSRSMFSKLNKVPDISMLPASQEDKVFAGASVPCSIGKYKVDERGNFGTSEKVGSKAGSDSVSRHDKVQFGTSSVIPSCGEQENASKRYDPESLTCHLKGPAVQNTSKSRLITLSGHESMYGSQNNDDGVCRRKMEVPGFGNFQNFGNGESSDPFSGRHALINSNSIIGTEQDRKLGVCSGFASATDKHFFTEDNMIRIFNGALEENKEEPSASVLPRQSGVPEISAEASSFYTTPANRSEVNEIDNSRKHELSLSFGNFQVEQCADSNTIEQHRYQPNNFNIQSVVHKTYGDQRSSSTINSHIPGDMKQRRPSGINFPDPSFNIRAHELGARFNEARPGWEWNRPRGDNIGTSGQNFMVGSANSSSQSGGGVTADGSWRTGHGNVFQGCFDAASSHQISSPSYFGTFALTSDKGEQGSFGVNKNYDTHADMLRPGRAEPVEYSFMGDQSSNSLAAESKIFLISRKHGSRIGNVFFHEPTQLGTQTGAIGTICPACSSRIPGQFNAL